MNATRDPNREEPVQPSHILLQFLSWVAARPRTYGEAMEAWRTSCPRLSVWEDATGAGLVRVGAARRRSDAPVLLTESGAAALGAAAAPPESADRRAAAR